jgi:hypothetical protein
VLAGADDPVLRETVIGPLARLAANATSDSAMVPVEPDVFAIRAPQSRTWTPVLFYELQTGERYLHSGARATPKVM